MEKENDKMYQLCEKIVEDVNSFHSDFVTEDGKFVSSQDMILALNGIIEKGFVLYKHIVETKFYEGKAFVMLDILALEKHMEPLAMTEENSKKLDLESALNAWKSCEVVIAKLACDVLDFRDGLN